MTPRIQAALDQLIQTIREETVASFSALLASGGTSGGSAATRSARVPRRSSGGKRTSEELAAFKTTLLGVITKQPGLRTEQIAKELGTSTKELQLPMLQLRDEKRIRMKGQKRAAQYFAR
jgi:hypothetical protein